MATLDELNASMKVPERWDAQPIPYIITDESVELQVSDEEEELEDLTIALEDLPPTEAGATGVAGNEGHAPVVVEYLTQEAEVTSGFDTTGITQEFQERVNEYAGLVEEEERIAFNTEVKEKQDDEPIIIIIDDDVLDPEVPDILDPEVPDILDPEVPDILDPEVPDILDPEVPEKQFQNNGFGNGDQDAPGNSEFNNKAENAGGNQDGTSNAPGNSNHALDIPQPHVDLS